jgi:mannose-6-phosphate isomerase-like protein (cupin superfamily)
MSTSFPSFVNLLAAAEALTDTWSPRVVAQVNDQFVKVARLHGQLTWHAHESEDEMFLILKGNLRIEYRDMAAIELVTGDMHVVSRGVQHNPVAKDVCLIALVEPVTTLHTGDVIIDRTRTLEQQLTGPVRKK